MWWSRGKGVVQTSLLWRRFVPVQTSFLIWLNVPSLFGLMYHQSMREWKLATKGWYAGPAEGWVEPRWVPGHVQAMPKKVLCFWIFSSRRESTKELRQMAQTWVEWVPNVPGMISAGPQRMTKTAGAFALGPSRGGSPGKVRGPGLGRFHGLLAGAQMCLNSGWSHAAFWGS